MKKVREIMNEEFEEMMGGKKEEKKEIEKEVKRGKEEIEEDK